MKAMAQDTGLEDTGVEETGADALIVGGGLAGPALALAMAREGLTSVVLDPVPLARATAVDFDGRAYAIALASRRLLARLGLWERLAPHAQEIRQILVSDGRPGEPASPLVLRFDAEEMGPDGFGHMIEDRHLRAALLEAARADASVRWIEGAEAVDLCVDAGRATVTLADGRRLAAPLAIGCDGRGSLVATRLGADVLTAGYGQVGLVCAVRHERPHRAVAHELFLPSGPFAILPLVDDAGGAHRSSIVWTERAALAEAYAAVSDAVYLAEIRKRFGGFLGGLELAGRRFVYPLSLRLADTFVGPRLALAGDAARGVHPIAGQGFNYGLRDVATLAEVLGEAARRGEDVGALDVLARYERWRRPDSLAIAAATDGLNRLFSNDLAPVRWARRLGLAGFGRIAPLRRFAMRYAAGAEGALPAAMRA